MAELIRLQVSIDERSRDRLKQMAGTTPAAIGWMVSRLVESGLSERKRLLSGLNRRLELGFRGAIDESERAGAVPVSLAPRVSLDLANFGAALDHSAAGMAGLIAKTVLDDNDWTLAVYTEAVNDRSRPR